MTARSALRTVLNDQPLAYHPCLAKIAGRVTAGILLGQLLYWDGKMSKARGKKWDGWYYKSDIELMEETGLSRSELDTSKRILKDKGFILTSIRGVPATTHYSISIESIESALSSDAPAKEFVRGDKGQFAGNRQTEITENPQTEEPIIGELASAKSADLDCAESADKHTETPSTIQYITQKITNSEITENTIPVSSPKEQEVENSDAEKTAGLFEIELKIEPPPEFLALWNEIPVFEYHRAAIYAFQSKKRYRFKWNDYSAMVRNIATRNANGMVLAAPQSKT